MKPEIAQKITPEVALEFLNEITYIHNLLCSENEKDAFFMIGKLTEQLSQRTR